MFRCWCRETGTLHKTQRRQHGVNPGHLNRHCVVLVLLQLLFHGAEVIQEGQLNEGADRNVVHKLGQQDRSNLSATIWVCLFGTPPNGSGVPLVFPLQQGQKKGTGSKGHRLHFCWFLRERNGTVRNWPRVSTPWGAGTATQCHRRQVIVLTESRACAAKFAHTCLESPSDPK